MNKYISMFQYVYTLKRRHLVSYNKHNIGVNKLEPVIFQMCPLFFRCACYCLDVPAIVQMCLLLFRCACYCLDVPAIVQMCLLLFRCACYCLDVPAIVQMGLLLFRWSCNCLDGPAIWVVYEQDFVTITRRNSQRWQILQALTHLCINQFGRVTKISRCILNKSCAFTALILLFDSNVW